MKISDLREILAQSETDTYLQNAANSHTSVPSLRNKIIISNRILISAGKDNNVDFELSDFRIFELVKALDIFKFKKKPDNCQIVERFITLLKNDFPPLTIWQELHEAMHAMHSAGIFNEQNFILLLHQQNGVTVPLAYSLVFLKQAGIYNNANRNNLIIKIQQGGLKIAEGIHEFLYFFKYQIGTDNLLTQKRFSFMLAHPQISTQAKLALKQLAVDGLFEDFHDLYISKYFLSLDAASKEPITFAKNLHAINKAGKLTPEIRSRIKSRPELAFVLAKNTVPFSANDARSANTILEIIPKPNQIKPSFTKVSVVHDFVASLKRNITVSNATHLINNTLGIIYDLANDTQIQLAIATAITEQIKQGLTWNYQDHYHLGFFTTPNNQLVNITLSADDSFNHYYNRTI